MPILFTDDHEGVVGFEYPEERYLKIYAKQTVIDYVMEEEGKQIVVYEWGPREEDRFTVEFIAVSEEDQRTRAPEHPGTGEPSAALPDAPSDERRATSDEADSDLVRPKFFEEIASIIVHERYRDEVFLRNVEVSWSDGKAQVTIHTRKADETRADAARLAEQIGRLLGVEADIEVAGESPYQIVRNEDGKSHRLATIPDGKKLKFVNSVDNIVEAASLIEFKGVRKAGEGSGLPKKGRAIIEGDNGVKVTIDYFADDKQVCYYQ